MAKKISVVKLRRELLQKFKGWSVVAKGELDRRGDDFDSDLSGHDPYMEFLEEKDERCMGATVLRPPGNLEENFKKLGDGERKQLTVEAGMAKIRYREALVGEYKEVLEIDELPFEFQLSGRAAKDLRSDFLKHAASASQDSPQDNKRMWGTLCPSELEAAKKLKAVLDELWSMSPVTLKRCSQHGTTPLSAPGFGTSSWKPSPTVRGERKATS
ncbi:hypothetical protein KFL_000460045 [Klebsormidium nitens]|uniref:Uncharacterized protein n=1 Tax=Klebsormidium nitens TaxID=105231 RepID=A0A1Y1HPU4_KLENI|nr:hypothetical protein KFL_000460045 [Klebsormidium nitens]|eukprot:GAQ80093.1 hypothetical protein KFL_000460045 [Klebsormidium nitens]